MRQSASIREAMLRFYGRLSADDVASFDQLVARDAALIIGTAPGEWVTDGDRMRFGFEAEGLRIETGGNAVAFEEESMGWVADEPIFYFPDGSAMKTRLTAVLRSEGGNWALVHMHVSVGVPDEEVVELQRRWGTSAG